MVVLFKKISDRLADLGMVSAYRTFAGIAQGAEPVSTHCFQTHEAAGFHIDFVFVPEAWSDRIVAEEVGT